jgi:hypothetical protein
VTAEPGSWDGTGPFDYGYQWQRCDAKGQSCKSVAGATAAEYAAGADDVGSRLRVVVSAGNWIASVSQASSAATDAVAKAPEPAKGQASGGSGSGGVAGKGGKKGSGSGTAARLALTKVTMSPKRFAVAHRRRPPGTRLDGARITWRLNRSATVRLVFQRQVGAKHHRRWVTVGTIRRAARAGASVVRFTGRFKSKPLAPRAYRLTVTATAGQAKAKPRRVAFRVVSG